MTILHLRINHDTATTAVTTGGWEHYAYDYSILGDKSWERFDGTFRTGLGNSRDPEVISRDIFQALASDLELIEAVKDEYGELSLTNLVDYLHAELDMGGAPGLEAALLLIGFDRWVSRIDPGELETLRGMGEE